MTILTYVSTYLPTAIQSARLLHQQSTSPRTSFAHVASATPPQVDHEPLPSKLHPTPFPSRIHNKMSDQQILAGMDRPTNSIVDHHVCDRCRSIPWAALRGDRPKVFIPESRQTLGRSACRICRMLATAVPFWKYVSDFHYLGFGDGRDRGQLVAIPIENIFTDGWHEFGDDPVLLAIDFDGEDQVGSGWLRLGKAAREYDKDIMPIVPETVDFAFARRCLARCRLQEGSHKQCAGLTKYGFSCDERNNTLVPYPSRLRVIDCSSDQLDVVSPCLEVEYVALSYVWGLPPANAATEPYSRVVMDAIKATRLMGFRYLWVDRHVCVFTSHTCDRLSC